MYNIKRVNGIKEKYLTKGKPVVYKHKYFNSLKKGLERTFKNYNIELRKYYLIKVLLLFIINLLNYDAKGVGNMLLISLLIFILTDLFFIERVNTFNLKLSYEISNVVEMLLRLLEANVPYKNALILSSNAITNGEFKSFYNDIIYKYEVNQFNNKPIKDICNEKYNNEYLNEYIELIDINLSHNDIKDMLENMLVIISNEKVQYISKEYKKKYINKYIVLFFLFIIDMALLVYPLIIEMFTSLVTIF